MVSLEDYVKQNIRLAKSLVIKSIDTAIAINKGLFSQTQQITPSDKKQWKYFLNIAGIKHPTNADVQVTVIEKGSKESLTKDLLNQYRYTKNARSRKANCRRTACGVTHRDGLWVRWRCIRPRSS